MTDLYGNIPISGDTPKKPDTPPERSKKENKNIKKDRPQRPDSTSKTIYLLIPGVLLFLIASYYGLTSFALPLYLEKKLPDIFLEKTGLNLSLGSAQFNPLSSTLVIQDLNIDSPDTLSEDNDVLDISHVVIDFALASIWEKAIITEAIQIHTLQINVRRYDDNSFNVSGLLPDFQTTGTKMVDLSDLSIKYSLNNLSVDGGAIIFNDMRASKVHRVEQLQLRLPTLANFAYILDDYIQPEFSAIINGSPLKLTSGDSFAQSSPGQQPTQLNLDLQSVDLPLYANYLPFQLPIVVTSGQVELQTEISFQNSLNSNFQINIAFQAQIANGVFTSHDESLTLNTPSLRLEGAVAPLDRQISIKNLLLRDPLLTVNEAFAKTTVDSLFLEVLEKEAAIENYLHSTKLDIDLLIADNGKVVLKTAEADRTFDQIQVSMRNFANQAAHKNRDKKTESSFLISGESPENSYNFSWLGSFEQNMPVGNVEINNFPASEFAKLISADAELTANGSAEIRGRLKLARSESSPFAYIFDQGTVLFSTLSLKQKNRDLLQSPTVKLSPVQISNKTLDFGNLFIENGRLTISKKDLSPLFLKDNQKRKYALDGIDYQGKITVSATEKDTNPLVMSNARLQFKEAKKKAPNSENFAFSADLRSNSTITAKGHISVAPIDGSIDLAIANIPASSVLSASLSTKYGVGPETTISATGRYSLKSDSFVGAAEISTGAISNSKTGTRYTFERAILGEISINQAQQSGKSTKIALQGLSIITETSRMKSKGGTISSLSFTENDIRFGNISLADTRLTIQNNFSKALAPFLGKSEGNLSIDELKLFGAVFVGDIDKETDPYVDNFSLILRELKPGGKLADNLELTATLQERGKIEAKGAFTILPLQTKLNLTLNNVPTEILDHFPTPLAGLNVVADMRGQLSYTYPERTYSGSVYFDDGKLPANDNIELRWSEAFLEDFSLRESPFRLSANRCSLNQPRASFTRSTPDIIAALRTNISTYLQKIDEIKKQQASPIVDIKRVDMQDGTINYFDASMSPVWQTDINAFEATINNFHIGDSANQITYSFGGDIQKGIFSLKGSYEPSAEISEQLEALEIVSLPLNEIGPQLTSLFDISIADSLLSLSLKSVPASENVAEFSISSLRASAPQSATALALALLSYDRETFSATIPIQRSNQTLFNQAASYLQRLIVKASVSPYLLLEEPFDNLEANQTISFAPGTAELSYESESVLTHYAMLLRSHPRLMLNLQSTVQRSADTIALRKILTEKENERVRKENERLLREWQQQQVGTTTPATTDDSIAVEDIPAEQLEAFTPITSEPVVVTEKMLQQLAIDRANRVRNFITGLESLSEKAVSKDYAVEFINTLDLPEVAIRLAHIEG